MEIIAIIQARMGSTRLPNKVLLDLEGKPVIEHVIERVKKSKLISEVIVATTFEKEDLPIVKLCARMGVRVFCGSEDDVLDRFYQAAKLIKPKHIVRITADSPVIDSEVIDKVIEGHLKENADYTSNDIKSTFPDGEELEIFTFESLKEVWKNADLISEREHVITYITARPERFKLANVENEIDISEKRWTLDNPEDWELISYLYKNLHPKNNLFGMEDILEFLKKNPKIEKVNKHLERNEGYQKSLKEDKIIEKED